ncbi:MAG: epoxyqueuosine reductase QueH [Hespellia sp.]|nr:epoxyqueuosine reductase QueH [Hespellia sp.]
MNRENQVVQKVNYQRILDAEIEKITKEKRIPTLLLHSCCAPCSSYVLEYLSQYFNITVLYYNPNIYPDEEYEKRVAEQQKLIAEIPSGNSISFLKGSYDKERFYEMAKGLEDMKEGGARCFACYDLRLRETACIARENNFDYFTTTLSISPLKNAEKLNAIGRALEEEYGVKYLQSDFKKKNGYQRSTELSREYGLYRQDYCGCEFSFRARRREMENAENEKLGLHS